MPVFNCERYIKDSIISIINQTLTDWELILINDNSTDSTYEIIKTFKDPRIRIYNNKRRLGLASCLNLCIQSSRGKYFARMDGDDIMLINRLEIQHQFLLKNSEVDVVGCNAILIDQKNNIVGKRKVAKVKNSITHMLENGGLFIHPSVMGKTSWFKKYQYNELFFRCQDLELWARTLEYSNFQNINSYLIFYRVLEELNFKKSNLASKYNRKILKLNKHKIGYIFYQKYKIITYLKVIYYYIKSLLPINSFSKINDYEFYSNELKKALN